MQVPLHKEKIIPTILTFKSFMKVSSPLNKEN
jgi:hypothetical protein